MTSAAPDEPRTSWWGALTAIGLAPAVGHELDSIWSRVSATGIAVDVNRLGPPALSRSWAPSLTPILTTGHIRVVYAYATSLPFGVADAVAVAAPWAVVLFESQAGGAKVAQMSDRVMELGLQGFRPLSNDELEGLKELKGLSPSRAALQLWLELNGVIGQEVQRDLRARSLDQRA